MSEELHLQEEENEDGRGMTAIEQGLMEETDLMETVLNPLGDKDTPSPEQRTRYSYIPQYFYCCASTFLFRAYM